MAIRKTGRTLGAVLAMAAVLASVGCSRDSDSAAQTPSTPSPAISATPTPSASPSPTPSTVSERAAVDGIVRYLEVLDRLSADPESDLQELNTVASGDALAQWQFNLSRYRADGWRQVGQQIPSFVGSSPGSSAAEWFVTMCIDVSAVDVIGPDGNSVKNPDSASHLASDFRVEQGLAGDWYVTNDEVTETC